MTRSPADDRRNRSPRKPMARPQRRRRAALLAPLLLVAPLLLLATCNAPAEPQIQLAAAPPPAGTAPRLADGVFVAADGVRLPLRRWLPDGPVTAVVLALHGFGDYSNAFDAPARQWAGRGIATYAYDQRGFGGAPGHGLWPGEDRLVVDAITASRLLRQAYPGRKLYLLGESMGGAVAILAASGAAHGIAANPGTMPVAPVDGVILSAPAVWGRSTMDLLPKLALFAAVRLFPDMVLTGRGLRILASDNIPMLRALGRDPMVLKGARVDTVYGLVDLMDDALAAAPHLSMRTLLLYGAHDQVIPRLPIEDFVDHLPQTAAAADTLAYYPHGYHLLLRDLDGATVADDVANWVLYRRLPLPSHADLAEAARPWPPARDAAAAAMPLAQAGPRR